MDCVIAGKELVGGHGNVSASWFTCNEHSDLTRIQPYGALCTSALAEMTSMFTDSSSTQPPVTILLFVVCNIVSLLELIMDEIAPEYDVVVLGTGTHGAHCFTLPHYILTLSQG